MCVRLNIDIYSLPFVDYCLGRLRTYGPQILHGSRSDTFRWSGLVQHGYWLVQAVSSLFVGRPNPGPVDQKSFPVVSRQRVRAVRSLVAVLLKSSVIVAAIGWSLRFATGPVPPVTLHAWCCVFRACFLGVKKAVLFSLAKKCRTKRAQRATPRGQGRDEAGKKNGLLNLRNVTIPAFRT